MERKCSNNTIRSKYPSAIWFKIILNIIKNNRASIWRRDFLFVYLCIIKKIKVMTKKERLRLNTVHVFEMVKLNFNMGTDFHDDEGHGYFTFGIMERGEEYLFDLSRNNFSVISHKIRGEKGHFESMSLESELEVFIKNELVISNTRIDNTL